MRLVGRLVGPALVGLAAWCAAGTIAVAVPDAASARFAVPASIWVWVVATVLASLVPAWRARPSTALPALLSTVAWWPVPLPTIGLLFTGPLAWLPILLALGVALGTAPFVALSRRLGADRPGRATVLAGLATLVCVVLTGWSAAPRSPGGDEPHYLVITQSLLEDGDIRIENQHEKGEYRAYYGGNLPPHYIVPGKNGHIYSVHAPGLSAVVLPGFALAGYRGAEATVMLLAAITGALIWRIGWWTSRDPWAAWFTWAAIALGTTFLIQGFTIYPDGPAMVAVAVATLLVLRLGDQARPAGVSALVASSLVLAGLPWLHSRFALIAGGFGVVVAFRLLADEARPLGERLVRLGAFLALPAVSAVSWFAFFYVIYGRFSPTAPYGPGANPADQHLIYAPVGSLAILFDGQFGLLTYAPVLLLAVVGWWASVDRSSRRAGLETVVILAIYVGAATTYWMWWAGRPAPPARFFAAMLPVVAIPLASAWMRGDALRRTLLTALVGVTAGLSAVAIGVARGSLAWNDRDAQSHLLQWLGPVVNLRRGWPSFFWTLDPGLDLWSEWRFVGRVALFLAVWLGLWGLMRRLAPATPRGRRLAIAGWLLGGLAAVVQAGWWANHVGGLDAEPAQAAVLSAARAGGPIVGIDAGHVTRLARFGGQLTMATREPGVIYDPVPWFLASGLPAGEYDVTLEEARPAAGALTVAAGDSRGTRPVGSETSASWTLRLPGDDTEVAMVPDEQAAKGGGRITLRAAWGR